MRVLPDFNPTPEQRKIVADNRPGFRIIRGAAGSGKTSTALLQLRLQTEARLRRRRRESAEEPVRVLVLTFNRTLRGYIEELARKADNGDDALQLEISTFGAWSWELAGRVSVLERAEVREMLSLGLDDLGISAQHDFFIDEIEYVLGRFPPGQLNDYLDARRVGRGRAPRVDRPRRQALLDGPIASYDAAKKRQSLVDWNDLALLTASVLPKHRYDIVIVDEAQDFSNNQVRAILHHLSDDHSTTFVLDAIQRIYPRYLAWPEVGIDARGISHKLTRNYRNTAAIARFALPLVADLDVEDDGALPDFAACTVEGAKPLVTVGTYNAQFSFMLDRLLHNADLRTETTAVLKARGGGWFDEARRVLTARGIAYCELTRESEWPTGHENVALCTMHSAKGLEFDHVLIPGLSQRVTPHGPEDGDGDLEQLRRMLAMAVGRARKSVMLGYKPGEESTLIRLLDPATYERVEL
ncbi:3'-5' exonuclease [Candidatus Poriferisodalis sp.]|uniref:3'-5' exonuclease n=1 Tax=Candidatus Poriferisodalis sp. TaxID=3101277 RepID=UPI003AF6BA9E